jgi:hypothetical protein
MAATDMPAYNTVYRLSATYIIPDGDVMEVAKHLAPDSEDAKREAGNRYRDHHGEDHTGVKLLLVDH